MEVFVVTYLNNGHGPEIVVFDDQQIASDFASSLIGEYDIINLKVCNILHTLPSMEGC